MKIENVIVTELGYLDALDILRNDLKSDTSMSKEDNDKAQKLVEELFGLLWKYTA